MILTRAAQIVAILVFIFGISEIILGVMIANSLLGSIPLALALYTPASSPGAVIDRGVYAIVLAVGLGLLAELCSVSGRE